MLRLQGEDLLDCGLQVTKQEPGRMRSGTFIRFDFIVSRGLASAVAFLCWRVCQPYRQMYRTRQPAEMPLQGSLYSRLKLGFFLIEGRFLAVMKVGSQTAVLKKEKHRAHEVALGGRQTCLVTRSLICCVLVVAGPERAKTYCERGEVQSKQFTGGLVHYGTGTVWTQTQQTSGFSGASAGSTLADCQPEVLRVVQ